MQVPRDVGYCDLQKLILKEMALMVHDDVLERTQNLGVFRPRLADHFHDQDCPVYLDMEVLLFNYTQEFVFMHCYICFIYPG